MKLITAREARTGLILGALAIGMFATKAHTMEPYIGFDAGIKYAGFKSGAGDGLFKSAHKVGSMFVGFDVTKNLALEISLDKSLSSSSKSLDAGNSKVKFLGLGTSLTYKLELPKNEDIKLFAGIGVKQGRVGLTGSLAGNSFKINKTKLNLKVFAGTEYMFTKSLGARTMLSYENTSNIKADLAGKPVALKSSVGTSIGVFWKI